jgi:hypothetical protein
MVDAPVVTVAQLSQLSAELLAEISIFWDLTIATQVLSD